MKKSLTLLLLVSFIQGFAYNGAERHDIPSSLQSGVFTTSKSRLAIDSAHKLLITSIGAGLIVFDGTNYSNFNTLNSGIASDTTNDVAVDMNNQYFVASESGMSVYNGAAWLNYTPSNSSLISKQLKTIFAHNNTVYVGGYKGFSIFTNGVFSNFSTSNSPLPNDTINAFAVDANSDVWIATNNGLCKWNGSTLSVFTTSNSALPFNRVNSLLTEGTNVWLLNQNAGITRMQNASFSALTTLANTPLTFSYSTRLSRGPKGGLLFINYSKNQICEYFEGRIYTYFLRTSFIFTPLCAQVFDSTGNKLWMSSLGRQIVSLDFNSYQNTLSSLNTSPPGVPPITAENCQSLDINQVNSAILNLGDMCWDGNDVKFEVPKEVASTPFCKQLVDRRPYR
ncbi:MAG: hypothetical protein IPP32_03080 [Bacteroidetes bacterium]|nr:hypothetical protein [Bacteroidota bacterium]